MADYWKSTPKYWCKHCSTHVKDTPFERKQHESTGRHQGNLKRFLRDIQNSHERDEREKQKAKLEVERLNKQFGGSQSSSQPSADALKKSCDAAKPQPTLADRQRQMAQLAAMGIEIPEEQRTDLGLAGGWKITSQRVLEDEEAPAEESLSIGIRKRKHEGQEEEEEAGKKVVKRGWGSTIKRYPEEVVSDLDALLATHKINKSDSATRNQPKSEMKASASIKTEADGVRESPPVSAEKKEELPEQVLADIPEAEYTPIFRFKKRRSKAVPT